MSEWKTEKVWTTKAGYIAFINRCSDYEYMAGWGCGYVAIPKNHPFYGKKYSDNSGITLEDDTSVGKRGIISCICADSLENTRIDLLFDVHGSITYSDYTDKVKEAEGLWVLGFDCYHYGDKTGPYDNDYIERECESLAEQLKKYGNRRTPMEVKINIIDKCWIWEVGKINRISRLSNHWFGYLNFYYDNDGCYAKIEYLHIRPFLWWFIKKHELKHVKAIEGATTWVEAQQLTDAFDRRSWHGILFWKD
jgi:hypothetical protein